MKKYLVILFVFMFCSFAPSQDKKQDKACQENDSQFRITCGECGCSGATASRWDIIRGEVTSIIDSDTITVQAENKIYTIDLIGIETNSNQDEIIGFLQKTVLNRPVDVSVKWKTGEALRNSGIVSAFVKNMRSINEHLLKNGMAKYKEIDPDALDDEGVTDCEFKLLEKKAKEAKLGIWAK